MKTAVVILNWNGRKYLEQFLPSVTAHTPPSVDIVVADNASADDSVSFLIEHYPNIKIVINEKNFGFAEGYNQALKQVEADIFILLNSDIEVTPGWCEPLVRSLETNDHLAAVQPKIRDYHNRENFEYAGAAGGWMDCDYYAFCRGRIFDNSEKDDGQYDSDCDISWATGACMAVKSDVFFKAGGFDSDFFAHMEEIDLCTRLWNMGYRIGYVHNATVYHVGGGTLNKISPFKTYLNYRNNLALIAKNHFSSPLLLKLLRRVILDGLSGVQKLTKGEFGNTWAIVKAHFAFYIMLPSLLNKRRLIRRQRQDINRMGLYPKSIIWQYFIKRKKTFSSLEEIR